MSDSARAHPTVYNKLRLPHWRPSTGRALGFEIGISLGDRRTPLGYYMETMSSGIGYGGRARSPGHYSCAVRCAIPCICYTV